MAISSKPYLLRAIHSWCLDADLTPHILAGSGYDGEEIPQEYITDGQILFDLSTGATRDLVISDKSVKFLANFGHKVVKVSLPIEAVIAIYAYENGEGITFDEDDQIESVGEVVSPPEQYLHVIASKKDDDSAQKNQQTSDKKKPTLTIIK